MLSAVSSRFPLEIHSLVTVQMRENAGEFTIVDVGKIHGQTNLIPEGVRRGLVNSRVDMRRFKEVY